MNPSAHNLLDLIEQKDREIAQLRRDKQELLELFREVLDIELPEQKPITLTIQ